MTDGVTFGQFMLFPCFRVVLLSLVSYTVVIFLLSHACVS